MKFNERGGGGVAIYVLTVFIIMSMLLFMAAFILIKQAEGQKQHTQVLLMHALNDAARQTLVIPSFDIFTNRLTSTVSIPPNEALESFCNRLGDGISIGSITNLSFDGRGNDPSPTECLRILGNENPNIYIPLRPNNGQKNHAFPEGLKIVRFEVVNTAAEAVTKGLQKINGVAINPPFIYARIAVPFSYEVLGKDFDENTFGVQGFIIDAVQKPNLFSNLSQDFLNQD